MEIERSLGVDPIDREFERLGYDIESRAGAGRLRFIEVKGRITGADTVSRQLETVFDRGPFTTTIRYRSDVVVVNLRLGADATETPDTGSLAGDVEAFLTSILQWFAAPLTSRIFPDLVAEAQRDPKLQALLHRGVRDRRRATAEQILQRGIARGELSQDVDCELALDLFAAPIFWRVVVTQGDTSGKYVRTVAAALLRAIDGRRGAPR